MLTYVHLLSKRVSSGHTHRHASFGYHGYIGYTAVGGCVHKFVAISNISSRDQKYLSRPRYVFMNAANKTGSFKTTQMTVLQRCTPAVR